MMVAAVSVLCLAAGPQWKVQLPGNQAGAGVALRDGERVLGLYDDALREVTVRVSTVRDPIADDDKPPHVQTGRHVAIAGDDEPLYLVSGPGLSARPVTRLARELELSEGQSVPLGALTLRYSAGALVLDEGKASQRLQGPNVTAVLLHFAGDLDGDGRVDLLLTTTSAAQGTVLRLYLSTAAVRGQRVRQVATRAGGGC